MTYLIPRLLKAPGTASGSCEWHYWLSTIGILVMSFDLIILGVFQGLSWSSLMPWEASLDLSIPFWVVRSGRRAVHVRGFPVFVSSLQILVETMRQERPSRCVPTRVTWTQPAVARNMDSMLETKTGVFFIAGLGFFGLAFLSNALVPVLMYRDLPEQTVEQLVGTTAT